MCGAGLINTESRAAKMLRDVLLAPDPEEVCESTYTDGTDEADEKGKVPSRLKNAINTLTSRLAAQCARGESRVEEVVEEGNVQWQYRKVATSEGYGSLESIADSFTEEKELTAYSEADRYAEEVRHCRPCRAGPFSKV